MWVGKADWQMESSFPNVSSNDATAAQGVYSGPEGSAAASDGEEHQTEIMEESAEDESAAAKDPTVKEMIRGIGRPYEKATFVCKIGGG